MDSYTVTPANNMITARGYHSICSLKQNFYVFGGAVPSIFESFIGVELDTSTLSACEVYDPVKDLWTSISNLPQALSYVTTQAY
jgi:hypothetical protein